MRNSIEGLGQDRSRVEVVATIEACNKIKTTVLPRVDVAAVKDCDIARVTCDYLASDGWYLGEDGSAVLNSKSNPIDSRDLESFVGGRRFVVINYLENGGVYITDKDGRAELVINEIGDTHHGEKSIEKTIRKLELIGRGVISSYANDGHLDLIASEGSKCIESISLIESVLADESYQSRKDTRFVYCRSVDSAQYGRRRMLISFRTSIKMLVMHRRNSYIVGFERKDIKDYEKILARAEKCLIPTISGQFSPQIVHCLRNRCQPIVDTEYRNTNSRIVRRLADLIGYFARGDVTDKGWMKRSEKVMEEIREEFRLVEGSSRYALAKKIAEAGYDGTILRIPRDTRYDALTEAERKSLVRQVDSVYEWAPHIPSFVVTWDLSERVRTLAEELVDGIPHKDRGSKRVRLEFDCQGLTLELWGVRLRQKGRPSRGLKILGRMLRHSMHRDLIAMMR